MVAQQQPGSSSRSTSPSQLGRLAPMSPGRGSGGRHDGLDSWRGGEVVVIRSPSPRPEHPSPGAMHDEDRSFDRVRIQPSRFGGMSRLDRFDGKGKGKKGKGPPERFSSSDFHWGSGGGSPVASLEPAWQVHARRRRRVARAILAAAAARGVAPPHDDDDDPEVPMLRPADEEEEEGFGKEGFGKGKGSKGGFRGGGGYQVSATRVHVSNLPKDITEGNLEHLFGQHGNVLGLQLLTAGGRGAGPGQICAIIRYNNNADAETAIRALHNKHEVRPGDGPIVVKLAKPNPRWDCHRKSV